jgi:lipopolysaccharide biosynthesis glycosyltransferase
MAKSGRGVLYIVWGEKGEAVLQRSKDSLARFHPELPVEVVRLQSAADPIEMLLKKAEMFEMSPFEETLFLDADTVVMGKLDYAFEKARQFGLACCICECPWARRYQKSRMGDRIEYNTGVLFFTPKAKPIFDAWKDHAGKIDSSIVFVQNEKLVEMSHNDQASFAMAVDSAGTAPFVLPLNWNFRPGWYRSFFGPIKIWHDYAAPPKYFDDLNAYYQREDAVIQYHEAGG